MPLDPPNLQELALSYLDWQILPLDSPNLQELALHVNLQFGPVSSHANPLPLDFQIDPNSPRVTPKERNLRLDLANPPSELKVF